MTTIYNPRFGYNAPATAKPSTSNSSGAKTTNNAAAAANPLIQYFTQNAPVLNGETTPGMYQWQQPGADEPPDNNPFDRSMYRNPNSSWHLARDAQEIVSGAGLMIGSMRTSSQSLWGASAQPGAPTFACYFLFNPNEIDKYYSFDPTVTNALPSYYESPSEQGEGQGLVIGATLSFALLFDRTFEVWRGPNNIPPGQINSSYGPGPYKYGVQWDIWAIERLLGVFGQWNGGTPSGPPLGQIVDVLFADPANPQSNNGFNFIGPTFNTGGAINITGWLQGLSVAYTRFDANMTPTRASVDIELQQVYSPGAVAPTTNNNTSSG